MSSSGQTAKIAIDTSTESPTEWNPRNSSLKKQENAPVRDTSSVLEKIAEFHKVKFVSRQSFYDVMKFYRLLKMSDRKYLEGVLIS